MCIHVHRESMLIICTVTFPPFPLPSVNSMGYRASVQEEANHSMKAAVEEVTNAEVWYDITKLQYCVYYFFLLH